MPLATGLAAVLLGLLTLLAVARLRSPRPPAPAAGRGESSPGSHPESLTAVLATGDEEYLAWLADRLWPGDEYLDLERGWCADPGLDPAEMHGDVRPDRPLNAHEAHEAHEVHEAPLCPHCALRCEDVWPCPACGRLLHSSCGHGMRRRRVADPYRTRGGGFESVIAEWICTGCASVVGLDVDHGDEPDRR